MTFHHLLRFGTRVLRVPPSMRRRPLSSALVRENGGSHSPAIFQTRRVHPENLEQSAQAFAQWMRENGYTDYLTPDELDSAYLDHCKQCGFQPVDPRNLRNALRSLDGVFYGRHRIASPRWYRLRQRVNSDRPVLYRIMDYDELKHYGDHTRTGPNPMSGPVRY